MTAQSPNPIDRNVVQKVVVMTGLPGTGKSEIAEALSALLRAPVFSKDWLEAPILNSGLVRGDQLGRLGYDLMSALLKRQLLLGQSAVMDSVASSESIRSHWRQLVDSHSARWYVIECVCSDPTVHRARMNVRRRNIPNWPELTWEEVEAVRGRFAPWSEDRLILDALLPLAENVRRAIEYVKG